MKDPRRLLDGDGSPEQRALLDAGAREEPPRDGQPRLLAALGITAPSGGQESVPPEGAVAASPPSSALTGGGSATLGAASATKLALLAIGGAVLLGAGALLWLREGETAAPADRAKGAPERQTAAPPSRGEPNKREPAPLGSVALEIEALERVRSQLADKNGHVALAALDRYASEHPRGVLAHEASVLRVEALLLAGEAAAARGLAEQLLRRNAESPHRARLEALAKQARATPSP